MPAKEDCAARSLVKGELRDEDNDLQLKPEGNDEEEPFDNEDIELEGMGKENKESSEDGEETGNTGAPKSSELLKENNESTMEDREENGNGICEPKSSELSYNQ